MSPGSISVFGRWAVSLAVGAAGGMGFATLNMPLPWMLGSLLACLLAAMAGAPLTGPTQARPVVVAVIGVMLGAGFHPGTFSHLGDWVLSLLGLGVSVGLSGLLVVPYLRRFGGMSSATALFAAMPGGLSEMVEIGRQMGGDERAIILAHTARIVLTIAVIAAWFRLVLGLEVNGTAPLSGTSSDAKTLDYAILIACGLLGAALGQRLRLPAPTFLGPMILSAAAHLTGLTASSPPVWMIIAAQIALGTILGCRFVGVPVQTVLRALLLSFGATAIMLTVVLGLAIALHGVLGQTTEQVLLAYSPGGLTEMSLIALSMNADVAYIATHHMIRVVTLMAAASTLLSWLARKL